MRGQLEHPVDGIIPWNVRNSNWLLARERVGHGNVCWARKVATITGPLLYKTPSPFLQHILQHQENISTYTYIYCVS